MRGLIERLPYHELVVEVICGTNPMYVEKSPAVTEVFNDRRGEVRDLFSIMRKDLDGFLGREYGETEWFFSNLDRLKKRDLKSFTGFKPVSRELRESFAGNERALGMIERLRCMQMESRPYSDLFNRLDSRVALFYVDFTGLDEEEGEGAEDIVDALMYIDGNGVVFGVEKGPVRELLIDEGWRRLEDEDKTYWVNFNV